MDRDLPAQKWELVEIFWGGLTEEGEHRISFGIVRIWLFSPCSPDGPSSQGKCRAKRDTAKAREVSGLLGMLAWHSPYGVRNMASCLVCRD